MTCLTLNKLQSLKVWCKKIVFETLYLQFFVWFSDSVLVGKLVPENVNYTTDFHNQSSAQFINITILTRQGVRGQSIHVTIIKHVWYFSHFLILSILLHFSHTYCMRLIAKMAIYWIMVKIAWNCHFQVSQIAFFALFVYISI